MRSCCYSNCCGPMYMHFSVSAWYEQNDLHFTVPLICCSYSTVAAWAGSDVSI